MPYTRYTHTPDVDGVAAMKDASEAEVAHGSAPDDPFAAGLHVHQNVVWFHVEVDDAMLLQEAKTAQNIQGNQFVRRKVDLVRFEECLQVVCSMSATRHEN